MSNVWFKCLDNVGIKGWIVIVFKIIKVIKLFKLLWVMFWFNSLRGIKL